MYAAKMLLAEGDPHPPRTRFRAYWCHAFRKGTGTKKTYDLTRPPRRTESRARRQAAGLFAQRRRDPRRLDLENLSRRRRLRRDPVGDRCAGLRAGADARDLCRGHGEPERALRDQAGLRTKNPARCRRRTGHSDMGGGGSLPVAARLCVARRQRRPSHARAQPLQRQLSSASRRLRTWRSQIGADQRRR